MSVPVHRDALPEHPDPDLAAYRPVSGWGIAALVVGLASAAALAHPLLWCVPLLGLGLSIVALRRIERSQVKVLGRKRKGDILLLWGKPQCPLFILRRGKPTHRNLAI
jgi:hypothetical protein